MTPSAYGYHDRRGHSRVERVHGRWLRYHLGAHHRPTELPELYPNWTTSVEPTDEERYRGVGPEGDEFLIEPRLEDEFGVIDFEIDAGVAIERSRSRLFDVDEHSCLLVHVAVRWEGVNDHDWQEHKRGTDDDLARMKRLIEADSAT